ncbi:hypothetical protein [Paenibacillus physcomitrellae]|uniref:SbsC C-terminal domain-containing protein n=1 Tax=Paenibacillus physcomitrellae TaxID=1619311 RepID=A0ABQ1GXI3_9BACL|nr:hypothetical protein [Paenibacillus physcomitrellae]GGA52119.1 hypothetical protein GCM10010917_41700 [Paenibacillus physcomitrellae]
MITKSIRSTFPAVCLLAASLAAAPLSGAAGPADNGTATAATALPKEAAALSASAQSTANSQTYGRYEALLAKDQLVQAVSYLKQHLPEVNAYEATLMTLHLENAQKRLLPSYTNKLSAAKVQLQIVKLYKRGDTLSSLAARTTSSSLRSLLKETEAAGYKLGTAEGSFYPVIDYESYKVYRPYVNRDIQAYIDIMAEESRQVPASDGALTIGYQQITARAVAQEQFIQSYPSSNRTQQIRSLFNLYKLYTFYGLSNTPLFDYDHKMIQPNASKGYQAVLTYRDPASSAYLTELAAFMKVVKANNGKLTSDVEQYRKSHFPIEL